MIWRKFSFAVPVSALFLVACGQGCPEVSTLVTDVETIDQRSYSLGGLNSFAEIVDLGIKQMALSSALSPADMDAMITEARHIAANHHVTLYRETDFLVTDLFPVSATEGKDVLIIYKGETLEAYRELKAYKAELVDADAYSGEARAEVAARLGKLLSYPDAKIAELVERRK